MSAQTVYAACKKCDTQTRHRLVRDKRKAYYACALCLENNCKNHRKKKWWKYLAQKTNARKRPNSDRLTENIVETIAKNQNYKCALTGIHFNVDSKWYKASLDRKDSTLGYIEGNLQLVLWIVNRCKGEFSVEEFKSICVCVANHVEECVAYDEI